MRKNSSKIGTWRPGDASDAGSVLLEEYVVGGWVVGFVQQVEKRGPVHASKLGTRLGSYGSRKAARSVVETRLHVMQPAGPPRKVGGHHLGSMQ